MMNASPTGPARDPVCGMMVDPATAAGHLQHGGQTYHFCCTGCLERFRANPASFLQPLAPSLVRLGRGPGPGPQTHERAGPPAPPSAPPGTTWICPMDPEVRQDHPGACPKCGMALAPEAPSAAEADNPELRDKPRRPVAALAAVADRQWLPAARPPRRYHPRLRRRPVRRERRRRVDADRRG